MLQVMERVGAIGKDRTGQGISYKFRGIDDLYNALHPALRESGVAMYPAMVPGTLQVSNHEITRKSGATAIQTVVTFDLEVQFVDVEDGSQVSVRVPAQGMDDSDKASGKAMSYGMKNACFHVLAIPTEDPDAERPDTTVDPARVWVKKLQEAKNIGALQEVWQEIPPGLRGNSKIVEAKDKRKERLSEVV